MEITRPSIQSKVFLFWSDERAVSPEDDESNYKMAFTHGMEKLSLNKDNIFRMKAEVDPHGVLFTKTAQKVDADIEDINDQFVSDPGITPEQMGANASLVNQMTQEVAFSATTGSK